MMIAGAGGGVVYQEIRLLVDANRRRMDARCDYADKRCRWKQETTNNV